MSRHLDQPHAIEQSFKALWLLYGIVPIVAGLDKFTNILTDWTGYLAPQVAGILPVSPETFMHLVGVIEIAAGIAVLAVPQVGAWIVSAWILGIAGNLLIGGQYLDVAVRDVGLAVGSAVLGRLAQVRTAEHRIPQET
jgi:hypothetical protein